MELENVACNLCGGEETVFLFRGQERRFGLGGSFSIVRCRSCDLVYLNPRPTTRAMRRYYLADRYFPYRRIVRRKSFVQSARLCLKRMVLAEYKGYPGVAQLSVPGVGLVARSLRNRFGDLPQYVPEGKLLDVGCGSGNYLYSLRELGWDVYGVEVDAETARYARDRLGLNVFSGTLREADFPDAFFHVVTMRHVLEHLPDPSDTLAEVYRVLKPRGRLMVEVPNFASPTARRFRNWWFNLDVPRHLYHFTPLTLAAMLEKSGFAVAEIEHIADTSGITGSLQYLWNVRTGNPAGNAIRRSRVLHLVLWPAAFVLARLERGEMIRAWGRKGTGSGTDDGCRDRPVHRHR